MKRLATSQSITLIAAGIVLASLITLTLKLTPGAGAQENPERPTMIPAQDATSAPTPPDGRTIAILTLQIISSEEGIVASIELQRARILVGYAPNVLDDILGEWTVELVVPGGSIRYGILDPRRVEAEGEGEAPSESFILSDITTDLIVPLYQDDQDLKVEQINIYDQDGKLIFSTPVEEDWLTNESSSGISATPFVPPGAGTGVGPVSP
jgi:hypothetical protein